MRHTPSGASTIWTGIAWYASFVRNKAFVQVLEKTGTALVKVDARTGAARRLGTVPLPLYELTPNDAGTRFVAESYAEGSDCCARLVIADASRRPIVMQYIADPAENIVGFGDVLWLSNQRFAFLDVDDEVFMYSKDLRLLGVRRGWKAEKGSVVVSGSLVGLRADGTLITAQLPSGRTRLVRRLPGTPSVIASATG